MPNNNTVVITLSAKDAASGVINNLNKSLEGATFKAQLLSQTLFAGVSAGLSALTSKFKETADLQERLLSEAATYAALTGRTFADAEKVIDKLGAKIDKFAGPLPGVAEDYKKIASGIQDDLIPSFTDLNGVFNEGLFIDNISEITKGLGVLSQASHVTNERTADFASKLLQGESSDALRRLEFSTSNASFLPIYERKLKELGKTVETSTRADRALALKLATQELVTPELISKSSNSINGLLGSFKDKLFSPTKGVFGLLKDLDTQADGKQSVAESFNNTLKALIGDNGLFDTIGKLLTTLGVDPDIILKSLKGGLDTLTKWIGGFTNTIAEINTNLAKEKEGDRVKGLINILKTQLGSFFKSINFKDLGSSASNIINSVISGLASLNYVEIFSSIGKAASDFMKGFKIDGSKLTGLIDKLIAGINSIDWSALFKGIGAALAFVTNILARIIVGLDWGKLLSGLLDGLGVFLAALDWGAIAKIAGAILLGAFAVGLAGLAATLLGVPTLVIGGIVALVVGLIAVIKVKWKDITEAFNNFWNFLGEGFENLKKDAETVWNRTISTVLGFFNAVQQYFTDLISKIPGLNQTPNTSNSGFSSGIAAGAEAAIPNGATGMDRGLLAAIARERRASPPGSGLVVANTTEAILTRQQQANLLNNFGGRGGLNIGTIAIYTQATDAESIAGEIFKRIEQRYLKYSQTHLSTATT